MSKAVEFTPYRIYGPTGKLAMSSDERCRYSPETELSLLESGHTIRLGLHKVTKKELLAELKGEKYGKRT